jgi:hypothetical protein
VIVRVLQLGQDRARMLIYQVREHPKFIDAASQIIPLEGRTHLSR